MGNGDDGSGGKRKRDESHERKTKVARHASARQERLEVEFAETYHGLTAMYKLLEIKQLQSPMLLPRTLSYRLEKPQAPAQRVKKTPRREAAAGADVREVKLGLTSDLMEALAQEKRRLGLRLAIYSAQGRAFADNRFTLAADCVVPVPCAKDVRIPPEVLPTGADVVVATFQVVEIGDLADQLAAAPSFTFEPPSAPAPTVLGKVMLRTSVDGRAPLYGNLLRIKPTQRRTGSFEVELTALASTLGGGVKCQFALSWDPLPIKGKMNRLDRIFKSKFTAKSTSEPVEGEPFQLAIPKRDIHTSNDRRDCSGVWFHFLYHNMLRRLSEKRPDYSCAWCNMYAGSLRGLVSHLVSSHDRFRFQATVGHDNIPHIYIMVVDRRPPAILSNGIARSALCELETSRDDGQDRFELHFSFMSPRKWGENRSARLNAGVGTKAVDALMHEFEELTELSEEKPQEFYAPLLQRQYFHSRTGAVVLDHEKDYDSDDDVDEEWIIQQSEKLLDEFEDVSLEEKEFMKKWNRHVKEFKILADFMLATSCRLFAKRHGKWLMDHGLRHNFLLHLFNLWDNSLLNSRAIIDCMLIVDHIAAGKTTEAATDGLAREQPAAAAAAAVTAVATS